MLTLERILDPFPKDLFLSQYLGKRFLYAPGVLDKYSDLLTWEALNDILENRASVEQIVLLQDGAHLPTGLYSGPSQLLAPQLTQSLRDGATMILNRIDEIHSPIRALSQQLEGALHCRVTTNMYAAWRASHGFRTHWDDHDVFILQIHGRKHWQIHGEASTRYPLTDSSRSDTPGPPIWEKTISPGDLLYLPRGWWHFATPCNEPTVHLTVGLHTRKGIDFLQWLANRRLKKYECVRSDLPYQSDKEAHGRYLPLLLEAICTEFKDPKLLASYFDWERGRLAPRVRFGLPWSAMHNVLPDSEAFRIDVVAPLPLQIVHQKERSELEVTFNGAVLTFDEDTAPVFAFLEQTTAPSISDFYHEFENTFDREDLSEFLGEVAKQGLVILRPPT